MQLPRQLFSLLTVYDSKLHIKVKLKLFVNRFQLTRYLTYYLLSRHSQHLN